MKTVFSNAAQTIHVWAQQSQSNGRASNVFFEGNTVYSYGYHYPLGVIVTNKKGAKAAIINTQGYSSTTSGHISTARQAVSHYTRFLIPNTEAVKALRNDDNKTRIIDGLSEAIIFAINRYNSRLRGDTVKRKTATLEKWKSETLGECDSYMSLLDWYGYKMNAQARASLKAITGKSPVEAREAAQKAAALEAKRRAIVQARQDKLDAAIIEQAKAVWLAGDDYFVADNAHGKHYAKQWVIKHKETLLRINGDDVETSKGASFPINHAVKAFALIQTVMKAGEAWQRNGKTLHLGNFQVDRIEPCGTVIAGCHTVQYSAIECVAKQLKLI